MKGTKYFFLGGIDGTRFVLFHQRGLEFFPIRLFEFRFKSVGPILRNERPQPSFRSKLRGHRIFGNGRRAIFRSGVAGAFAVRVCGSVLLIFFALVGRRRTFTFSFAFVHSFFKNRWWLEEVGGSWGRLEKVALR